MSDVGESLPFDPNSHFELQATDDAAFTYRMLQVIRDEDGQPHIVETDSSIPLSSTAAENKVSSSMSNSDTKVYAPTSAGQYFVMMSPSDVSSSSSLAQRAVARLPLSSRPAVVSGNVREDRRKQTHKEVERRRRDKINTWISHLAELVPECSSDIKLTESKCAVLAKTCDYITSLAAANESLSASVDDFDASAADIDELRQQYSLLQAENQLLWAKVHSNGIEPPCIQTSAIVLDE